MLIFALILSFIIALFIGGRFGNIKYANIKGFILPVIAFALQAFLTLSAAKSLFGREPLFPLLLSVSYLLLFLFLILNVRYRLFVFFAGLGTLCNFVVISLNDFYMPLSAGIIELAGLFEIPQSQSFAYSLANETTKLPFLGDIIYFPIKFFRGFASVGDVLLCIGVMCLIIALMRSKPQ